MPGFENACFISYKHPPSVNGSAIVEHRWLDFIEHFEKELNKWNRVGLRIYRDSNLNEAPGARYPAELAQQLCKSVCLIAIIVPEYLESKWCKAEWAAMEALEKKRALGGQPMDLIIPILFRGDINEVKKLVGTRTILDFSRIVKPAVQLPTIANLTTIETIADRIKEFADTLTGGDCQAFQIDVEEAVTERHSDPDPLG